MFMSLDDVLEQTNTVLLTKDFYEQLKEKANALDRIRREQTEGHSKIGKWIEHIHNGMEYIECSECQTWFLRMYLSHHNYCPKCGQRKENK